MIHTVALAMGITAAVALGALEAHLSAAATVASAVIAQAPLPPPTQSETPAGGPARRQATPGLGDQKQIEVQNKERRPERSERHLRGWHRAGAAGVSRHSPGRAEAGRGDPSPV
jgi:hypothetical protein